MYQFDEYTDASSLRDRILAYFKNDDEIRPYITDEVILANMPDSDSFADRYPVISVQLSDGVEPMLGSNVADLVEQWTGGNWITRYKGVRDEAVEEKREELKLADDNNDEDDWMHLGFRIHCALDNLAVRTFMEILLSWRFGDFGPSASRT